MKIHIGFERGTGEPVDVELSPTSPHIAIFGQTGLGKTVLVRRIIEEIPDDYRILAFDTREGVEEFRGEGHRLPIYVRETTDSLVLKGLLESIIQSSLKREYATLVRVTEGAKDYTAVIARLDDKIEDKRTHAVVKDMMVLLRDLLRRLKAEMRETETASDVDLRPGLNVMALNERSKQFKQLAVRAVLPLVYKKYRKLVVFLDEGQEYIPQKYSSAAKEAVDDYIRTARGKDDYMVIAAQSITSTDKDPLKQCHTWIHFGQATKGEASEAIDYIPHADKLDIKKAEVMTMPTGVAIVSTKSWAKRTYVQPTWLPEDVARKVARRAMSIKDAMKFEKQHAKVSSMDEDERKKYEMHISELEKQVKILKDTIDVREKHLALLEKQLKKVTVIEVPPPEAEQTAFTRRVREMLPATRADLDDLAKVPAIVEGDVDLDTLARKVADMLTSKEYHLRVDVVNPSMTVRERVVEVSANGEEPAGRMALLIAEGFFDERKSVNEIRSEFRARGWGQYTGGSGWNNIDRIAKKFAEWGFLRNVDKGYVVVPEAKARVRKERA